MTKLLISGSRKATHDMLEYARRCVQRADVMQWTIIVGDAEGIDRAVMWEAHRLGVECIVYGAYGHLGREARRRTPSCEVIVCDGDYLARDAVMAQVADKCIAVWNGSSRGTMYTLNKFKRGRQGQREWWLKDFSKKEA